MKDRTELQARRERLVLDHFADETRQDFDAVLGTFPHPHYELIPTGEVHDGMADVRQYYADTRRAFPDQRHEIIQLRHADCGEPVEVSVRCAAGHEVPDEELEVGL